MAMHVNKVVPKCFERGRWQSAGPACRARGRRSSIQEGPLGIGGGSEGEAAISDMRPAFQMPSGLSLQKPYIVTRTKIQISRSTTSSKQASPPSAGSVNPTTTVSPAPSAPPS